MTVEFPRRRPFALALVGMLVGFGSGCSSKPKQPVDPTATALQEFSRRVDEYVALRNQLAKSVGQLDPTKSQYEITARATALAQSIVAGRAGAKAGDIFTPEAATIIATIIRQEYSRRTEAIKETREDQQEELPDFVPQVNMVYPTTYPLATFPPTLLPLLPPLPKEVEYRIVQSYLILRDIESNLIIDLMPRAVPAEAAQ